MSEESTNPVEGVEAEALPESPDTELDQPETEGEEVADEPEVEEVEIERAGRKYRIPKEVEAELLMHGDYTRKTQSLAEERRQIAAQAEAWQAEKAAEEAAFQERVKLSQVQEAVKQYEALDWQSFHAQNAEEAQRQFMQYTMLKGKAQELEQTVSAKKQEVLTRQQQMREQVLTAANDYLRQQIPDWSPTKAQQIRSAGTDVYGFKAEELASVVDPRFVRVMHDAMLYRKSLEKASKPVEQKPQPTPVRKVGGSATPVAKAPEQMSDAEWAKWRDRQEARKRRSA